MENIKEDVTIEEIKEDKKITELRKLVDKKDDKAEYELGKYYLSGDHTEKKVGKIIYFVSIDNKLKQKVIKERTLIKRFTQQDKILAFELLLDSANKGNSKANKEIVKMFKLRYKIDEDSYFNTSNLTKAIQINSFISQQSLISLFDGTNWMEMELVLAIEVLKQLASNNNQYAIKTIKHWDISKNKRNKKGIE